MKNSKTQKLFSSLPYSCSHPFYEYSTKPKVDTGKESKQRGEEKERKKITWLQPLFSMLSQAAGLLHSGGVKCGLLFM